MDSNQDSDRTLVSKYESVFCVFMAALAYLWRDNPNVVYPHVLYSCLVLLALNLAAGFSLRRWPSREGISAAFILANCGAITAILAYSGGPESNLWVLYLLPIYTACLLLGRREIIWITAGAIGFSAALLISERPAWGMEPIMELLLKSGVFVLTAAVTWRIVARDRKTKDRLRAKRKEVEELGQLLNTQKERLEQAQKLAELGLMSTGIAHDMNNTFMVILGLTDIALHGESLPQDTKDDLEKIYKSATLGKNMVSNFVGLARKDKFALTPCRVAEIVQSVLSPLEGALDKNQIKLELALDADIPLVMGSQTHLQRLILNLVTNAMRAMKNGGVLAIKTEMAEGPKPMVTVRVEDSGPGIPDEIMANIFKPFRTTNGLEGGTGLGLYICSEIAMRHDGRLYGENRSEGGARFALCLPISSQEVECPRRDSVQMEPV